MDRILISTNLTPNQETEMLGFIQTKWLQLIKLIGLLAAVLGLLMPQNLRAEASFGQASDIFNIGAGARSMAMGGAFTGLADDASAPYFNPAGLALLDEHQLMGMYSPLFVDSSYNYLATANPFGDKWGALALSGIALTSDKFEVRDQFNNLTNSNGDLRNSAILASYAHKVMPNVSAGANFKFIQQRIVGFSDSDFGLDVGLLYRPSRYLGLGYSAANINNPELTLNSSPEKFRTVQRIGLASEVFQNRLVLTGDFIKVKSQDSGFAAGAEWNANKFLDFRGGYNQNRSYTLGMGIKINTFRVDYAFSDTEVGEFNKISFTWAWHNIYMTEIDPPLSSGRPVFPLSGFENRVAFKTSVPDHVVARWNLIIKNGEGKEVRMLDGDLRPPEVIEWDARNDVGEPLVQGIYHYTFNVKYKNGKQWKVDGNIQLDLPKHKFDETIDMNIELNGARAEELEETPK